MRQRITIIWIVSLALSATLASSQAAPPQPPTAPQPAEEGRWWKDSTVVGELDLERDQVEEIEQLFFDFRLQLVDRRAELEREQLRLQPLIDAEVLDMPRVKEQVQKVVQARGQLEITNTLMMLSIREKLSREQWMRLREIEHLRRAPRAPRPPLAPRPPSATLPRPGAAPPAPAPEPAPVAVPEPAPEPAPRGSG